MSNCFLDNSGDLFETKGVQHLACHSLWFIFLYDGNLSVCSELVVVTKGWEISENNSENRIMIIKETIDYYLLYSVVKILSHKNQTFWSVGI